MTILIKNRHIYFCVENCFMQLSNSFTSQLYNKVSVNDTEEFVQEIEIDKTTFITIMNAVNSQPQGVALDINKEIYDSLKVQLIEKANNGDAEAVEILTEMAKILEYNAGILQAKILNGKTQILS